MPGVTIRGVVVNDSTGVPVSGSRVYGEPGRDCRTVTDDFGRFVLSGMPAGSIRIYVSAAQYKPINPLWLDVEVGATETVEIRLVEGGPLRDCRAVPACALLVDGEPVAGMDDAAALRLAALGTVIGLVWGEVTDGEHWYACLDEESLDLLPALSERYSPVVSHTECELPEGPLGSEPRRMRHAATGSPAFGLTIDRITEPLPNRRAVRLSYYVGPLWAAAWECDVERGPRGWRPTLCIVRWIS